MPKLNSKSYLDWRSQIEDTVCSYAETGPDGIQVITAGRAREALMVADSMKSIEEVSHWVAAGMNVELEEMHDEDVSLLDEFNKRLRLQLMMPTLPPNQYVERARVEALNLKQEARIRAKEQAQALRKEQEKQRRLR